jgi:mRNA interferase RelE/StbE
MGRKRNGRARSPEPRRIEIRLTRAAERGLSALDKIMLRRVDAAIGGLAVDQYPPGSKKLQGAGDLYRIRVANYRVIYRVEDNRLVVLVIDVGHRHDIYRDR